MWPGPTRLPPRRGRLPARSAAKTARPPWAPAGGRRLSRGRRNAASSGSMARRHRGPTALAEHIGMVWLTPLDGPAVLGPAGRAAALPRPAVYAIDTGHAARVQRYDRARRHRARLLRAGTSDDAWLGALERSMAENAVAIGAARLDLASRLEQISARQRGTLPEDYARGGRAGRALACCHPCARGGGAVQGAPRSDAAGGGPKAAR